MEKYSTFSGLTSLQANNLHTNKTVLPEVNFKQVGFIGDYVTSGDHLTCDISSLDIWLDVHIEAGEIGLVIFLEIKVYNNKLIKELKKSIVDVANQIFHSRSINVVFEDSEAVIKKIELVAIERNLTMESKSILDQNDMRTENYVEINENSTIGQEFEYLDRYVYVKLVKKKVDDYRENSLSMPICTLSESLLQISSSMPIRNLRVEPQVLKKNNLKTNASQKANSTRFPDNQNCKCVII